MVIRQALAVLVLILVLCGAAAAHEDEADGAIDEDSQINGTDHGVELKQRTLWVILFASALIACVVIAALIYDHKLKDERMKWVLFLGIAIPVLAATVYAAGTTIYLNRSSATGGPVHWHADFEVWKCGQKIDLKDPTGLSNRIGSPVFHEHNDHRIHVEGVVIDLDDVSLHNFFEFVGGELAHGKFVMPTNDGFTSAYDGDLCNGQPGKVQVFLYRVKNPEQRGAWAYEQQKLTDFEDHVPAPYGNIPPGDCVIIEFDVEKDRTDKICSTYTFAQQRGELHGS